MKGRHYEREPVTPLVVLRSRAWFAAAALVSLPRTDGRDRHAVKQVARRIYQAASQAAPKSVLAISLSLARQLFLVVSCLDQRSMLPLLRAFF